MKTNDKETLSVAEAVKAVLEGKKIKTETEVQKANKDFVDLHAIDKKKDPEQEKQVEEKDEVEEGNEFTKAAAKAKLAGEDEFEFEGKTYPVEIEQDAAEKILGKKESVDLEEAVDNFFGFPTKDKLVKFQSMAKKLKITPISNPTVLKRGGKEFHVMGFEGSVSDIEKAMKVAGDIIKEDVQKKTEDLKEFLNRLKPDDVRDSYGTIELKYRSSADIRDAEDKLKKAGINVRKSGDTLEVDSDSPAFKKAKITSSFDSSKREKAIMKVLGESTDLEEAAMSQGVKTATTQIYSLEKSLKAGSNLNRGVNKSLEGKYDADFKKMQKAIGDIVSVWEEIERDFSDMNESTDLDEASNADLKKVLATAKKLGGIVKGNTADFGQGAVIDFSIEKGKIKFDGGLSSGVEYFKNVKDAIDTLMIGFDE